MKVLVLHASALHLGFVGCYGNTWIYTPNMDRLAAEGVVFDQHFANDLGRPLSANSCQLSANSCQLSVVSCRNQLENTLDAVTAALEELADKPRWLCWVDLPSLHPPWDVAEEFTLPYLADESAENEADDEPFEPLLDPVVGPMDRDDLVLWERLRCTYAGAVTYLDAGLGLLFEELKKLGLFDDLTVILTCSRGLALGEHGIVGDCKPWLHEEVVHLPLILRQPGGKDGGLRVNALTQPVDLTATLRDMLGEPSPQGDGRSLLPLVREEVEILHEQCISRWNFAGAEEWALRTPRHALLLPVMQQDERQPRNLQLYNKPEDRWELNNVVQHHLELAEELEKTLRGHLAT
jgi:arylsulfatase A-like enzyme